MSPLRRPKADPTAIRPKKGRPRGKRYDAMLAVRLPEELLAKLDAYVEKLRENEPGFNINRTDAVRRILMKALQGDQEP